MKVTVEININSWTKDLDALYICTHNALRCAKLCLWRIVKFNVRSLLDAARAA